VCIGKLPMLAHQVVEHVSAFIIHALQKCLDLKGCYQESSISLQLKAIYKELMLCETRHRCCAPIPALGD
jgi:hypothetical protein